MEDCVECSARAETSCTYCGQPLCCDCVTDHRVACEDSDKSGEEN